MMKQALSLAVILLCVSRVMPLAQASADCWQPPPTPTTAAPHPDESLNPLIQGIRFFQRYISPVDSPRCPMYPSCSAYALQALQRHGPVLGTCLTVDRLLHETSPAEKTQPLPGFNPVRYADPLENNDFWLACRQPAPLTGAETTTSPAATADRPAPATTARNHRADANATD